MRHEQQAAPAARDRGAHFFRPVDLHVEVGVALRQQEDAIQRAAREREQMPPSVLPARRTTEHAA
jgi:hypothetical protein